MEYGTGNNSTKADITEMGCNLKKKITRKSYMLLTILLLETGFN